MDVKLPNLGEGADSGSVVNVLVNEGDQIHKDQIILELENEKAVAPIPSPSSGTVTKIHVRPGDRLSVGQMILSLSENSVAAKPAAPAPVPPPAARTEETADASPVKSAPKSVFGPAASPSIRKIARDLGIDLAHIQGGERGGRIVLEDLRAYIQRLQKLAAAPSKVSSPTAAKAPTEAVDFAKWGVVTRKRISPLRKAIAKKMVESSFQIPHVTQFDEADITRLLEIRKKYAPSYEAKGARLTLTPFVLKAAVVALKKFPRFNSSWDEAAGEIVCKEYYHIGVGVDTEAGLMVPVLRDVDQKGLLDLSVELEAMAQKTRLRKVSLDEMKGGSFTLSNQGGIGGGHFTPVINAPEVAILGLGKGAVKAVVRDGKIEPRTILPVCVSYDHRIVDGGDAVRFTREIIQTLEQFKEEDVKL